MSAGRDIPVVFLVTSTRLRTLGQAKILGIGSLAARSDKNLASQRRSLLNILRRPGRFRSLQRQRLRLLPVEPVNGDYRERRDVPVRLGLETPAASGGWGWGWGGGGSGSSGNSVRRAGLPGPEAVQGARAAGRESCLLQ